MKSRTYGRALAAAALVTLPVVSMWPASASAAAKPTATVTCEGGVTFEAQIVSLGTFHEAVAAGNFQVKYLAFGDTVVRDVTGVATNHDLLTCSYVGPESGNQYTLKGFFTPAS
jgi:hypothetical protein